MKSTDDGMAAGKLGPKAGLTLIELMAVVFIAGLLSALVLGIAGYASGRSDRARAEAELQQLRNVLEEYRIEYGTYPVDPVTASGHWESLAPYITNLTEAALSFEDPWGRHYRYQPLRPQGQTEGRVLSFDLWSTGPTGPNQDHDFVR